MASSKDVQAGQRTSPVSLLKVLTFWEHQGTYMLGLTFGNYKMWKEVRPEE